MYIVLLRFTLEKAKAGAHMAGHNAWLARGFEQGIFVLAGSLQDRTGGSLIAYGLDRSALDAFIAEDPFVAEGIVTPEVIGIEPKKTDDRLNFLVS